MIETIVIAETIVAGIVRRVDVDEFNAIAVAFAKGIERKQVVAFDDEVIVRKDFRYFVLAFAIISKKPSEGFRFGQAVNLVWCQCLIPENLVTLGIFFGLTAFQHTILIRPRENDLATFGKELTMLVGKSDLVFEGSIAVRQELLVHHKALELHFVEHQQTVHLREELPFQFLVRQQIVQQLRVKGKCCLNHIVLQQMTVFRAETAIHAEHNLL